MANFLLCFCIFRIALPTLLTLCFIFRPCGLSAFYLLYLLIVPFIPVPTIRTIRGCTGFFMQSLIAVSILLGIAQLSFQIVLLSMPPYAQFLKDNATLEKILRHVGFVRLDNLSAVSIITWISPEILMIIGSIVLYVVSCKLAIGRTDRTAEEGTEAPEPTVKKTRGTFGVVISITRYLSLASLCFAAVLRPSIQGGVYFLVFLTAATWWACYKNLGKGFAIVLRCLMIVVFVHIACLYGYQLSWPQEYLGANSTYARYFGLTPLLSASEADPRTFEFAEVEWASVVNPLAVLWLYYILALESRLLLNPKLIRSISPGSKRYGSSRKPSSNIMLDSTGSVTIGGGSTDDIPMQSLEEEVYKPTVFENIMYALESLIQVIVRTSYIATNIIMMTWSITFISWLTFVLLIWANLLWLIPKQRKSMLRSSPFLVAYAWFLLLSAYIYSMNLTEDELPSNIVGFNMKQIGFEKIAVLPCNPLLIKCLYTTMFWITLRQYMQERKEERQSSALADMVAPLQVTMGTATGVPPEEEKGSKVLKIIGDKLKKFLTKFWIWIVAITLFAVAITGERMTGFRIIYMALFLVFILSFQISFSIWRRMMFGFWLTVIVYSMIILVLVYTYQFDNFKDYFWRDLLHVPYKQQLDIGLEQYETKQLFVRLFTPTFFVIITVIQLHYFHKDFMEMSQFAGNTSMTQVLSQHSSVQDTAMEGFSERSTTESGFKYKTFEKSENETWRKYQEVFEIFLNESHRIFHLTCLLLEFHMPKILLLFAMLLCVYDKCALYLIVIFFIVISLTVGRKLQSFFIYATSILVSILLLARMVYQIQYIQHGHWDANCTNASHLAYREAELRDWDDDLEANASTNNAEWVGFRKSELSNLPLSYLVKWNIIYILMVTLWAVIIVRQFNYRVSKGLSTARGPFMFPRIRYVDADKSLQNYLKYLANFAYYRFGVEISLMATMALIGFRMDMYALIYAIWLVALFAMQRQTLAVVWDFYLGFIAVALLIQYFMTIGLPPGLCITLPWTENLLLLRFQDWAYLLSSYDPPNPKKLVCDFILLLAVSRQAVIFKIEKRYAGQNYPGGSNESIIHHAEDGNFVNPVPDFITYVRSYLDVFKRGVLLSFLWITLAIMFLAGTNRVNLFSLGYLGGAFIFLWQGTDLYLKPIPSILRSWNWLLGYNVVVILIKTSLQIIGCIFITRIPSFACFLIQLLGIGCVRKFHQNVVFDQKPEDMCTVPREYIGLVWDGLCFGFLLTQRRIFQSYNFFHMIDETKASTILASRGADLIEELRQKQMIEQDEAERTVLEKIKAKMDRIKANQQKIQGPGYSDVNNHHVAIRSGDYYMFDDLDDEQYDVLETEEQQSPEDLDDTIRRRKSRKYTVGELLSSAMKTDIATTVRGQSESMPQSRRHSSVTGRSQLSAPLSAPPRIAPESGSDSKELKPVDSKVSADSKRKSVEIEPVPSTSKDYDLSDMSEAEETLSLHQKIINLLKFIWIFIESVMISITRCLNQYSRDHRFIMKVLRKEKKILKEKTKYNVGVRWGPRKVWQPAGSYHSLLKKARSMRTADILEDYEIAEMSSYDQPTVVRLLLALWFLILSHSDMLCYFIIFLNQIKSATFLSLALPLMVFLWGTLTIPRPTKTFWVSIIAYTEIIVLIKCMFQFEIISWNKTQDVKPYFAPKIIGIDRNQSFAVWDLLVLLVVFFHRSMLKSLGLWRSVYDAGIPLPDGDYEVQDGTLKPVKISVPKSSSPMAGPDSSSTKTASSKSPEDEEKMENDDTKEGNIEESPVQEQEPESGHDTPSNIITLNNEALDPSDNYPEALKLALKKYGESITRFFAQLSDPTSRVAADVYSYMFLCDFFNFFVILIGYSSFGAVQGDGGVSSYLTDNRVPVLFLLMLILQFMLIIIDRAIFLRKFVLGKIIFQFLQIFILHIWLFILYPVITDRSFNSVLAPQMYYMVKCFYLLLSAYQIRCGYPTRILGNFLCKGYTYLNMGLFKVFMAVPFLFELRTVMDWMWTDTSMTIFDWIKMEDIFAHIFQLKCSRHVEDEYPQPRGERKSSVIKYIQGGLILAFIIAVIWFPLVFFSLGNAVGEPNIPEDVSVEISIGPYEPIYQISAQTNSIFRFQEPEMQTLVNLYVHDKEALSFLANYEANDVAAVKLSGDSSKVWGISPPDKKRMIDEVNSTNPVTVRLQYTVTHKSNTKEGIQVIREEVEQTIPASTNGEPDVTRQNLLAVLIQLETAPPVPINRMLPKFLKVSSTGSAKAINMLMSVKDNSAPALRNLSINLLRTPGVGSMVEWWEIREDCNDPYYTETLQHIPYIDCDSIVIYTFSDKIFPATLSFFTGSGIIGLYTTLVFVASRILRGVFSEICFKIMFEDLPNVDRVLQLCLDIYLVREAREFILEEDLFAKLVFLFRSPETLIKWTRPKEEQEDEDNPEGDNRQ